ncbi:MAG TPA: hypothetical protein VJR92_04250 [Gemmatimonadaceae bacterium]|nr:hypothetical protein [Gemmatimonadaceae bacterium]
MTRGKPIISCVLLLTVAATLAWIRPDASGMTRGNVEFKSLGAMTFGPNNVLFVGDHLNGNVLALQIDDKAAGSGAVEVAGIDAKVAQALGTTVDQIAIEDMAVHPASHNVYLTVRRGAGADMTYALLRVTRNATRPIEEVSLADVKFSTAPISNPSPNPGNARARTITDIAYADGQVWVAGLSNEQFASAFRRIAYPFSAAHETSTLQIYHVSHRASETRSPIMTFAPLKANNALYMIAGYTCTPLVTFDATALKNGQHVNGRTVAELGAGNQPSDITTFTAGGREYVLVANSRYGMMKLSAGDFVSGAPLTTPDGGNGIARTEVSAPGAIVQLADFDADRVIVIQKTAGGGLDLKSVAKSTL